MESNRRIFGKAILSSPFDPSHPDSDQSWAKVKDQPIEVPRKVAALAKLSRADLSEEFSEIRRNSRYETMETRVKQLCGADEDHLSWWMRTGFGANFIKSAFKETKGEQRPFALIIASVGPEDSTVRKFWELAVENNVRTILTLCESIGTKGKKDAWGQEASQYFPRKPKETLSIG